MKTTIVFSCLMAATIGCSPASMLETEMATPNPAPPSTSCPAPATPVPFAQLWAEAPRFVGCDVVSEVAFVSMGSACPRRLPIAAGDQCVTVSVPNQENSYHMIKVGQGAAGQFFSAASKTVFQVRGTMAVDLDMGVLAFVASGAQLAPPSAPAAAPAAAPAPTPAPTAAVAAPPTPTASP